MQSFMSNIFHFADNISFRCASKIDCTIFSGFQLNDCRTVCQKSLSVAAMRLFGYGFVASFLSMSLFANTPVNELFVRAEAADDMCKVGHARFIKKAYFHVAV